MGTATAEVRLSGRIQDENGVALPGTQVVVTRSDERYQALADPTGKFSLPLPAPGDYVVSAERQGYFRIDGLAVHAGNGPNEITLVLNHIHEIFEKVDVAYSPPTIDFERTTPEERLTGTEVLDIPYPSTNTLRNALRAIPGVVQDSGGDIHLNGGAESQILYTLDGFQLNDPLTGRFESRLSVESVSALDVSSLNPAEYGKEASGVLAIKTSTGDDTFRYSGTNFLPGLENRKGLTITGWSPRFNFSGPIWKGRAWFSEGFDIQYDKNVIDELPKGQDTSNSWRLGNLVRTQVNLTPANIFYASFLWNLWTVDRYGLGALTPVETTLDRRSRQWFFNFKDQWTFGRGAVLEVGYGKNLTYGRETPQGNELLSIAPDRQFGNAYQNDRRNAGRDQFLANVFLPAFRLLGAHQLKTGVDIDSLDYGQTADRSGYTFLTANGLPTRSVRFAGSGTVHLSNSEAASYIQDSWKPRPSVLVDIGLREDWDRLVDNVALSPRLGISWAPPHLESTKISAGYGLIREESNLRLFSRPLDQSLLTTYYLPDGAVAYGPVPTTYAVGAGPLRMPRSTNYSVAVEQRVGSGLFARFEYIGRRGRDGLAYLNIPGTTVYELRNARQDTYDAFAVTFRQTFRKQYEWLASYTRSRALSSQVLDVSTDIPQIVFNNSGPLPWDAPNRLITWGYLPTPFPTWAVAYLTEIRNGFPFSVQDGMGVIQGAVDRLRYPAFFEMNLHLERKFVFRNYHWAFRFGFNNITNHKNPNVVDNTTTSPHFLAVYGGQSRAFNVRLRWLGKN